MELKIKKIISWNRTYQKKSAIYYPRNINELSKLLIRLKKEKKNYLIKTGGCSYDSKSISPDINSFTISLSYFNKIYKIDKKKKYAIVESGVLIPKLIKELKKKQLTLSSIPGGQQITIGGAISANVIGKDSSKKFGAFGDNISQMQALTDDHKIKNLSHKREIANYIGAFGFNGIILKVKLKLINLKSQNIYLKTKILKNIDEVFSYLNQKYFYKYIQFDPFFRKKNFAILFAAFQSKNKYNLFKNINLEINLFEKYIFIFCSFFINKYTWKLFYFLFFFLNKEKKKEIDLHNFHYSSKYKHLVPYITKKGLIDYEIMISKNFKSTINKLIYLFKREKIYPIYAILKKTFKSKNKYFYSFNQNGYALAVSFDNQTLNSKFQSKLIKFLSKNKLKLNLSKTDKFTINKKNYKNNLNFMSLYKKIVEKK